MVLNNIKRILYTSWCCILVGIGVNSLQAQTGPQGLRLYQIENADTANTGDSRASYENYFVVTKLDTFGIDDYRLYYEDTLFTVLYGAGDSTIVLNVGDTMYIEYPEPTAAGGDSTYIWRLTTNGVTVDTIVNGETVNLVAGANITITQAATDVTIDADSCLQNLLVSGDSIFLTDCAGNRLDTVIFDIQIQPQNDTYVYQGNYSNDTLTLYRTDTTGTSIDSFKIEIITSVDSTIPDTYVDSSYVVEAALIDSIWIYRDSLGITVDSFLTILNDSIDGYEPDTYVDTSYVITDGLIDTIWFLQDSAGINIDSFFIVLEDSIQVDINYADTYADSAYIGEAGLNDTLFIVRVDTLGNILNTFYTILNDSINVASNVVGYNGLTNQASDSIKLGGTLVENTTISGDQGTYDLTIDTLNDFRLNFDNTLIIKEIDAGGTSEGQLILGALNAATSLKNFTSNNAGRFSIQSASTRWQWGDTTDFAAKSEIYMNNTGLHINPEDQAGSAAIAAGHILQAQDANGRAQWKAASEIDGIADYDWVQLENDSTQGFPIANYLPTDTIDIDSLLWRRGEIRIGNSERRDPYGGKLLSTLNADHTTFGTGVQIYGDRTGIDHSYHNNNRTGPYWWMRNDYHGDVFLRINGYSGEGISTPQFDIGWISQYDTDDAGVVDTTFRAILQIDADSDASALWIENNYLRSLNYPNTRTDDSIVVDSVFSLFTTDNAGRLMLVSLDTINAALNVAASAPQEIDTFSIVNDSLLLDLENTVGGIQRVDLSPYVNDSLIISNDTISLGDDIVVIPEGADSLGTTQTAGQVIYSTGGKSGAGSDSLFWDATNGRLGVGTSSPRSGLDVIHTGTGNKGIYVQNNSTATNALTALNLVNTSTASTWGAFFQNGPNTVTYGGPSSLNLINVRDDVVTIGTNNIVNLTVNNGAVKFNQYGSGTFNTAAPAYWLGVDASGNILERTDANLASDIGALTSARDSFFLSCFGCGSAGPVLIEEGETITMSEGSGMTLTHSGNSITFNADDNSATNELQDLDVVEDNPGVEYRIDLSDAGPADDVTLVAGTNITLSEDTDNHITITAAGGAADGDGIYDGDGTVPSGTDATLSADFDIVVGSGQEFRVASAASGGTAYIDIDPSATPATTLRSANNLELYSSSTGNISISAGSTNGILNLSGNGGIDITTGLGTDEDITLGGDDIYLQADVLTDIQSDTRIGGNLSDQLSITTTASTVRTGHEGITTSYIEYQEDGDIAITASAASDNISINPNVRTYFTGDYLYTNTGTDVRIGTSSEQSGNILNVSGSAYKSDGSTVWNTTSDRRTKKNIVPILDAYEKLMQLRPVSFEYKDSWLKKNNVEGGVKRGYIAQDYREVFASDVKEGTDGLLNMNHEAANIYTTAAVQQLIKDKEALEETVAAQKNQIDQLQRMFFNLQQQVKELQDANK